MPAVARYGRGLRAGEAIPEMDEPAAGLRRMAGGTGIAMRMWQFRHPRRSGSMRREMVSRNAEPGAGARRPPGHAARRWVRPTQGASVSDARHLLLPALRPSWITETCSAFLGISRTVGASTPKASRFRPSARSAGAVSAVIPVKRRDVLENAVVASNWLHPGAVHRCAVAARDRTGRLLCRLIQCAVPDGSEQRHIHE